MKGHILTISCAVALICTSLPAFTDIAPELREEGVLYFDYNLPNPVFATVHAMTTVYIRRDFQLALGSAMPGQKMELIGMSPEGYLVKTAYRGNNITGWIQPQDLPSGVDPDIFTQAKKNQARHDAVAVAIQNKNVIQGMTTDEVKQSIGKPEKVTTHSDPHGDSTVWTYMTYREDPQYEYVLNQFGQAVLQTYYVKVPIGRMVIGFINNQVISVSQTKVDPNSPGVVTN